MALTKTQVSELYVAIFNRASEGSGNQFWQTSNTAAEAATAMLASDAASDYFGSALDTNQDFVEHIYLNTLDKTLADDPDGIAFWVDALSNGLSRGEMVVSFVEAAQDPENAGDAQDRFLNRVAVSDYAADNLNTVDADNLDPLTFGKGLTVTNDASTVDSANNAVDEIDEVDPVDPGTPGDTFRLTASTDELVGTANDDTFLAKMSQNPFSGGVSNTLSSADEIDGGAGTDTLTAVVTGEFVGVVGNNDIDIQPTTKSVENVTFEARDYGPGSDGVVNVDAKRMVDVEKIGSSFSDGNLVIENLTTLTADGVIRNTKDMTITMDHTEGQNSSGGGSNLTVYFDEDYLNTSTTFGGSSLEIRVVNAITNVVGDNPIYGTASFTFNVGGENVGISVEDIGNDASLDALGAYTAIVDRINDELADKGLDTVSAELGSLKNAVFSIDITTPTATYEPGDPAGQFYPIVITNTGPDVLTQGKFAQSDIADDTNIAATQLAADGSTTVSPITTNIELEKVGRDGEGGALIVGGQDQNTADDGEEDQNDGFEVFNVFVNGDANQPSNLKYITSTDQSLRTVNIANGSEFEGASLHIREAFNGGSANLTNDTNIETVNANSFSGDLTIGSVDRMMNVDQFTATGGGDVTVRADISGVEKAQFSMTTGAGSDNLDVTLHGDAVDTVGTGFAVSTGGGSDTVIVSMVEGGVSHNTTESLDNLSIDTGSGDDKITLVGGTTNGAVVNAGDHDGDANFNITAGAGSDTVYINSISEGVTLSNSEVQTITVTAEAVGDDAGDELVDVAVDTTGDGALDTTVAVDLTAVDTTDAGAIGAAIETQLNANGAFSAVATATNNAGVVTVAYSSNTINYGALTVSDNTGSAAIATSTVATVTDGGSTSAASKGEWSIGTASEPQTWNDRVLYEATLTVNYAGFEQQVTIDTDSAGNFIASQATINAAVIDAISSNSELSRLLETTLGTGNERLLTINALHEGANDLTISVNQPTVSASSITGNVFTGLQAGLVATNGNDSTATDSAAKIAGIMTGLDGNLNETGTALAGDLVLDSVDGTDGTNEESVTNYSVIDMGTGTNDLVVLNSDVDSVNTLDFTAVWGKVSVVNWFEKQATPGNDPLTDADTGNHILDFTVWLDDQTSASGSELSAVRTATTTSTFNGAAGNLDLGSNEVVVFNGFSATSATAQTWAGMTAANVDGSLEGTTAYGSAAFGNTAVATPGSAYPTSDLLDSILMVENDLNAGEYKVFNVETDSTAAAGSQYAVTLLGVIDFGETIDGANGFSAANLA